MSITIECLKKLIIDEQRKVVTELFAFFEQETINELFTVKHQTLKCKGN